MGALEHQPCVLHVAQIVAEIGCRGGEHMKRLSLFILFSLFGAAPPSSCPVQAPQRQNHQDSCGDEGYFLFNFSLRFIITMSSDGVDDNAAQKTVADPTPEKAIMFAAPPP